jgi:hypothetical protein
MGRTDCEIIGQPDPPVWSQVPGNRRVPVRTGVQTYGLEDAYRAFDDLRHGRITGAAVWKWIDERFWGMYSMTINLPSLTRQTA